MGKDSQGQKSRAIPVLTKRSKSKRHTDSPFPELWGGWAYVQLPLSSHYSTVTGFKRYSVYPGRKCEENLPKMKDINEHIYKELQKNILFSTLSRFRKEWIELPISRFFQSPGGKEEEDAEDRVPQAVVWLMETLQWHVHLYQKWAIRIQIHSFGYLFAKSSLKNSNSGWGDQSYNKCHKEALLWPVCFYFCSINIPAKQLLSSSSYHMPLSKSKQKEVCHRNYC